jgi:Icc-related predicted phosphoesterase
MKRLKIWLISDTHGKHAELKVPEADVIVHCGDESNNMDPIKNEKESLDFFDWFTSLNGEKYFVPGNHSTSIFERLVRPSKAVKMLIDDWARINNNVSGLRVYGSPWTPTFGRSLWAYNKDRKDMYKVWQGINGYYDIIATHGPPKGILDIAEDRDGNNQVHCGCRSLFNKIMEVKPKVHCFGHIHSHKDNRNAGIFVSKSESSIITFINCSVVDNQYNLINNGVLLDWDLEWNGYSVFPV